MLKLWGRASSANVQKVTWLLGELGAPVERIDHGGRFGGNADPRYLALNPNGLVPTLVDGDLVLWESNTILRYLSGTHGGAFLPADPGARALCERWMDWQLSVLSPAMKPVYQLLVRNPDAPGTPAAVAAGRKGLDAAMALLDAQLARTPYLGGEAFSLGDIPAGIQAYRWFGLPLERPDLPALADWYGRLHKREPFRRHVAAIPFE